MPELTKAAAGVLGSIRAWHPEDGIGQLHELLIQFGDVQPRPESSFDRGSISLAALPGDIDPDMVFGCDSQGLCLVQDGRGWNFQIVPAAVVRGANKLKKGIGEYLMRKTNSVTAVVIPVRLAKSLGNCLDAAMRDSGETNRSRMIRRLLREALAARGVEVEE
jgi:hypothetical protein